MSSDIKPPRPLLGKNHRPTGCTEDDSEEMLPIPASPACSPLYSCKQAVKWGETFVNQICSCFITLLISVGAASTHPGVWQGDSWACSKGTSLPLPLWHHAQIWFKPKTAGREEGNQSQDTSCRPDHRSWKTSTWVLCACLSGVFAAKFPLGHMCMFN